MRSAMHAMGMSLIFLCASTGMVVMMAFSLVLVLVELSSCPLAAILSSLKVRPCLLIAVEHFCADIFVGLLRSTI